MSDTNVTQRVLSIPEGKTLTLTDAKVRPKQPNYYRVGNGTMNKHNIQAIDFIDAVMDMTKPEQFLIKEIKQGFYYDRDLEGFTYITKIDSRLLTSTQKQYIVLGYKLLHNKGLVKRVKRGYYMINPNALVPSNYETAKQDWDNIKAT